MKTSCGEGSASETHYKRDILRRYRWPIGKCRMAGMENRAGFTPLIRSIFLIQRYNEVCNRRILFIEALLRNLFCSNASLYYPPSFARYPYPARCAGQILKYSA
jgi:hypothetical protein